MKTGDQIITYQYDSNGNRIKSSGQDESLDYIYDTENRLLAVKDKEGMLFAALYDGDDNRVFTASRTQATNTYQLFKRAQKKGKAKSPKTSPNGEENSIFWYGFSQNVLQFLSSFASSQGYDWRETFDTISVAYHQKVAKDRATKEGLVVHPPSEDNLPGQDPVTYASEVQDVLIPYTTKEDTYNYYEVRNYINDVNQENAQVLETYDDQHKARETYTYGNGRASYHNNQTGDTYNYLTSVSGSVTGLTKDGSSVASSSYQLYGATKESSDQTGNPFAYNGEARDITGLDYLRARYYDNQVGTFLTEDSYSGEETDPLSQNLYSYVQNNPVNYTDPSGHFWKKLVQGAKKLYNKAKTFVSNVGRAIVNTGRAIVRTAVNIGRSFVNTAVNVARNVGSWVGNQVARAATWVGQQYARTQPTYYASASPYSSGGVGGYYGGMSSSQFVAYQQQQAQARAVAQRQQNIRNEYAQATGIKGTPKSKEAKNMYLNWGKALAETLKHVCDPKTMKGKDSGQNKKPKISVGQFREIEDAARHGLTIEQKKRIDKMTLEDFMKAPPMTPEENAYASNIKFKSYNQQQRNTVLPALIGELSGKNNLIRVWTGKDPITGKDSNRWLAGGELGFDLLTTIVPIAKAGKVSKIASAIDAVDDVSDATKAAKAVDKVDDASDAVKASKVVDKADEASDSIRGAQKTGRAKNKIKPDVDANGPHSVYKRDQKTGQITNYRTYESNPYNPSGFQEIKGYDGVGAGHKNPFTNKKIETPHVHDPNVPGKIREPYPWEIPLIQK